MKLTLKRPGRVERTETRDGYEVIHTKNTLRAQALVYSKSQSVVDEDAIARAEGAMQRLAGEFNQWMETELARLLEAWAAFKLDAGNPMLFAPFHRCVHDIKGQAATFGYPLAGHAADSLSALLEKLPASKLPMELVERHVDAIRAITHNNTLGATDLVGADLVKRLNQIVVRMIANHRPDTLVAEGGPRIRKAAAG